MNIWQIVGIMGVLLTATQLLPQIIKSLQTKHVQDLSLGLILIVGCGAITWIAYGVHLRDYAIVTANIINVIASSILLVMKLKPMKKE